jgi:hypothetical protein
VTRDALPGVAALPRRPLSLDDPGQDMRLDLGDEGRFDLKSVSEQIRDQTP